MKVYIEKRDTVYPDNQYAFAPSIHYPEYIWSDISPKENAVYDMVRECLHGYGYDAEHYGTCDWNPLGDIIHPGNTVVIKPNWVEDKNKKKGQGLDCVVTNAAIIRAVIDYVHIALHGTGEIIVGDSPMPDCDFHRLMENGSYNSVWESCKSRHIDVKVMDFREDIVEGFGNAVVAPGVKSETIVDLEMDSLFSDSEYNIGRYRNGIVDSTLMNSYYHQVGHHRYSINNTVLRADVIINLPKPKTHRKAGYTAALKNFIGICSVKRSIPHNVTGNIKEGGDTYHGPKFVFQTEQNIRDRENKLQYEGKKWMGIALKCCRIPFYIFRRLNHKKYYGTGNWYKNDTIWRSILDINRIIIYADKNGVLQDTPQRKFLAIGDMVVSGEKNGPLEPSAKKCGIILCSESPYAFDLAVTRIMGFQCSMLPTINKISDIKKYIIPYENEEKIAVFSNIPQLNDITLKNMPCAICGQFEPAEGWKRIQI